MSPLSPPSQSRASVTGHSYTAAYRYELVIGKVGGWAIPYPLTIPQAVAGLSTVVFMMVTASWWYPFTGISGAVVAVIAPIVGIRVISRIRPEGRSVADWMHGWMLAQSHQWGSGVQLTPGRVACSTPATERLRAKSPVQSRHVDTKQPHGVRRGMVQAGQKKPWFSIPTLASLEPSSRKKPRKSKKIKEKPISVAPDRIPLFDPWAQPVSS